MSDTPPATRALPPPADGIEDAEILPPTRPRGTGALAPLRLDLGLHGVPGLVAPGEAAEVTEVPGAPKPPARLTRAEAALAARLFRRRAPLPLEHDGRTLRCVLLPAAAAPASDGPWLSLTLGGQPAALRLGWNLARRLAGVPLDAVSPEDRALILEDALTPWLDAAEALLGIELRFLAIDRKPALTEGANVALGVEAGGGEGQAARQILPLRLDPATAATLTTALDRWTRPREVLDGLWLRAAVEIEATRLAAADIASLQIGDALLIEGGGDATAQIIVEEQLVAPAVPGGGPAAGQATWRLTNGFAPRGPLRHHDPRPDPARTEGTMSDSDDRAEAPDPGEATTDAGSDKPSAGVEPEAGAEPPPAAAAAAAAATDTAAATPAPGRDPLPSLDRLEVRLSIRMGETMMTLAELRQAGPGTILTLDRPDGALVEIVANGQPIGTGEVISVSGQRAVEIRTLFADG